MSRIHEITLAGFDGGDDETDHLVVWVAGDVAAIRAIVEGTGATLHDPVPSATPADADFTLPGDADALRSRISEQDLAAAPGGPKA